MREEIIAAIATAWGEGGIAVVRLSGEGSTALTERLFRGKKALAAYPPRYLALGELCDASGVPFDEVLAVRFAEGASYTAEESVEIHCHGGVLAAQKCIETLCAFGARIAAPGEFTRRAFVNGRINLAQAEAVLGVIRSKSDEALRASGRTLQGAFTASVKDLLEQLNTLAAQLEVDLDFPEEGQGLMPHDKSKEVLDSLIRQAKELFERSRCGLVLREGVRVAIVGRPNVGKSSLLNALLKETRAIVTPIPGTTRDRIEEILTHKGLPIRLIDTAGIRETRDEVESIGVRQSVDAMEEADLRVWVVDAAETLSEEEIALGKKITARPHLIVLNKQDLKKATAEETLRALFPESWIISISALKSEGIETLKEAIAGKTTSGENLADGYGVTSRQLECLTNTMQAIEETKKIIEQNLGDDLAISAVAEARAQLAALLGLDATEELLDTVFSSFCVGK